MCKDNFFSLIQPALIFSLCLCLVLFSFPNARADDEAEMEISDLEITRDAHGVDLFFNVRITDPLPVLEAMEDGTQLRLECLGTISEVRNLKWDKSIAEASLQFNFRKNILTQDVVLNNSQDEIMSQEVFPQRLAERLQNLHLRIDSGSELFSAKKYLLSLEVTLTRRDVPSWVQLPLLFGVWDILPKSRVEKELPDFSNFRLGFCM
jgi:hypothetical protein